jgi:hypothetical protein
MENPSADQIMQVGLGFWASKTLLSAVEMELFTELAKHPEDLESLQGRLRLHPRSARDFLDTLIETAGGFDYTAGDCMDWMKAAGFSACRVEHLTGPDSMVIGIK